MSESEQEPYTVPIQEPWPPVLSSSEEEDPFVDRLEDPIRDSEFSVKNLYDKVLKKISREQSLDEIDSESNEEHSISETKTQGGPIQLVKVNEDGRFEVCKKGAKFLKSLKGKMGVVSIGGPTRGGKSFILNLLSNGTGSGFAVGSKVQACTQGIWIWGEPIQTSDMCIIFLDSEGCKSVEKSATHDAKMFAVLILLSSVFIYNSKGVIDEQAVNQLSLATSLSEMISTKVSAYDTDEDAKQRLAALAPKFVWLLRDFHLSLVDEEDNPISSKQYMENILNMKSSYGRNPEKYGKIRQEILDLFRERDCITLPRPIDQERQLELLNEHDLNTLRPKFKKGFERLQYSVLQQCPSKKFDGLDMSGRNLLGLLNEFVKAINDGVVPNINSTWSQVMKNQYEDLLEDIKKKYTKGRNVEIQEMPYETGDLLMKLQTSKDRALALFRDVSLRDEGLEEECREDFELYYQDDINFTQKANLAASEAYNLSLIEKLFKEIIINLDQGKYTNRFESLDDDWANAMKQYEKLSKGPGKFSAISEFSRKNQHSAFARLFQDTIENYENEIKTLRKNQKKYETEIYENKLKNSDDVTRLVYDHINNVENELGIVISDKDKLEEVLEQIEKEILNALKKKKTAVQRKDSTDRTKPKGKSCGACTSF
ncbi:unnamed protein product [Blepharisma stoltei]|uniref:GB1/RHD3-type G domain-containing protein n=1 Tax=Blepharisma stoltei TaxID=1481888 RepID=A0AAU9KIC9_9CILI|nr:unnamed protein product [Blepharisma stoltei]